MESLNGPSPGDGVQVADGALVSQNVAQPSSCYACGQGVTQQRIGVVDVLVCRRCGMGRVQAQPKVADYWTRKDPEEQLAESYWSARRRLFERALRLLSREGASGRVLDFGGGVGHFTECALELGWDAYTLDSSELAVRAAADRLGPERSLSPERVGEFTGTCDVVTLWCVIAHVPDPLVILQQAMDLLKPGGRLVMTTPNFLFQAIYARILAKVGRPLDFVEHDHLLHFTPAALDMLLSRAGLGSWSYRYLGVTEDCLVERRLAGAIVPLKRAWNWGALRTGLVGLPPLCAELQVIGSKPA